MSAVAAPRRGYQLGLIGEHHRRESFDLERHRRERTHCSDGGRLTLEQRLDSVWEGLRAAGAADCPVCGSRMTANGDGGGHCGGCGTTLS